MSYLDERRKFIEAGRPTPPKKNYSLNKISPKRAEKIAKEKEAGTDIGLDKFFERNRKKMVGVCQCGCGQPSQKKDDTFYRHCICHIFPKSIFKSIATNDYNWVERTFWGGDHSNMDNRSMDLWPNFADWQDIREKFFILGIALTDEERATKFYTHLEKLVYGKVQS